MTEHRQRTLSAAVSIAAGLLAAVAIFFGHAHHHEQPLMIVIDGAPHLRGAHQQKPNGVKWTPPLGGPQTVAGADVPREDSKKYGELQSSARGGECKSVDPERGNPSSSALTASPKGLTGTKVGTRRSPQREPVTADKGGQPRADEASRSLQSRLVSDDDRHRKTRTSSDTSSGRHPGVGQHDAAPQTGPMLDEGQVMPNARGYGFLESERPRGTSVTQRDSTSREGTEHRGLNRPRQDCNLTRGSLPLRARPIEPAAKEGVTDGRNTAGTHMGTVAPTQRSDGGEGAGRGRKKGRGPDRRSLSATEPLPDPGGAAKGAAPQPGGEPWTNVTDQPWTTASTATTTVRSAPARILADASFRSSLRAVSASVAVSGAQGSDALSDCRPSADTKFTPSAAAWIAKANAWADAIDAKYDRAISVYYDRLRCNGSIPYGWYVSTHNTLTGAAFSDETPVEWMCAMHMDSPLAAMMVHTLPVMRPTFGGPYTSVLISYNDHDARIGVGEGTEYVGCGKVAGKPCQFRAAFPCVWPLWKLYDDGKGGAVAVVSGWDVKVPGRIHPAAEQSNP